MKTPKLILCYIAFFQFQYYNSKYLVTNNESDNYLELKKDPAFADKEVNFNHSTVHIPTDVYSGSKS